MDPVAAALQLILQQQTANLLTGEQAQAAIQALFSGVAATGARHNEETRLARAKQTIRTVVPEFTGDQATTMTAGRWLETFETEATDARLPRLEWALSAVRRFPTSSAASMWAVSVFGGGLRFAATWEDFLRHSWHSIRQPMPHS